MGVQYLRTYEFSIFNEGIERKITGLKIVFKVTKSLQSFPNLAEIKIYNTNKDTQALFKKRLTKIKLQVGYGLNKGLIFIGEIKNIERSRQGTDHILTVFAGDGQKDWEQAFYNKTLQSNVTLLGTVKDIASTFITTVVGELKGLSVPPNKLRGQTLSGPSKGLLDTLAEDYGFKWSIQDGAMTTIPEDEVSEIVTAQLVNNATGMIGEPTVTDRGANVRTLLNPALTPNSVFKIESSGAKVEVGGKFFRRVPRTQATGLYKIFEVIHEGDTHGKTWYSNLKGGFLRGAS